MTDYSFSPKTSPPQHPEVTYRLVLLGIILRITIVSTMVAFISSIAFRPSYIISLAFEVSVYLVTLGVLAIAYELYRRRRVNASAMLLLSTVNAMGYLLVLPNVFSGFTLPVILATLYLAGVLLPSRYLLLLACLNVIGIFTWHHVLGGAAIVDVLAGVVQFIVGMTAIIQAVNWYHHRVQTARMVTDQKYERLFTSSRSALAIVENERIAEVNPTYQERMSPVPRHPNLTLEAVFGQHTGAIRELMQTGNEDPIEIEMAPQTGQSFPASVTVSRIDDSGKRFLVSIRDLTIFRQSEETRFQLELERERVRLMRDFIGDASHDLRTPLTVMQTSLYLLCRTAGVPEGNRHAQSIQRHITYMTRMFDDLLSLSNLDRSNQTLPLEPHPLDALVAEEVHNAQELAAQQGRTIVYTAPEATWQASVNPTEFARAVRQLLTNAIKYTEPGGRIEVYFEHTPSVVSVCVQDDGIGIQPDELPHLFERFYRADGARSTDTGGMGVGLSIVQRVMEIHGGTVTVESTPGVGSCFRLNVPLTADGTGLPQQQDSQKVL